MLFLFDVDGTLVEGFLDRYDCAKCEGKGHFDFEDKPDPDGPEVCPKCHGKGYLYDIGERGFDVVTLLPGVAEKVAALSEPGITFGLVTNQGGVAFGHQTPEQVRRKLGVLLAELNFFGGRTHTVHVCFEHPQGTLPEWKKDAYRRKPSPGMIYDAMREHRVSRRDTYYVGDMDADRDAAEAAGIDFTWAKDFFGW